MNKLIGFNINLFKLFTVFFLVVSISFLNIGGCGSSGNNSKIIGPEGGNVRTSDGVFNLFIPPGALTEDTEISIVRVDSGLDGVIAYNAEPDGLIFLVPARFSGDVTDISNNDGSNVNILIGFNVTDTTNEELDDQIYFVDLIDGSATYSAEVDHFSTFFFLNGTVRMTHTEVPERDTANTELVDFDVRIFPLQVDIEREGTDPGVLNVNMEMPTYVDLSSPMVLYRGIPTPFDMPFNPSANDFGEGAFTTTQPYDCGNPGLGVFNINIFLSGTTQVTFPDSENVSFGPIVDIFSQAFSFTPTPFNIRVPGIQEVLCVDEEGEVPPPPPPGDDDDDMGDDDDDDSMQEVSISADTTKVNIDHTIGVTECPTFGAPIKVTATGTPPEVRIVVVENLDFLDVTPGNILTDMGMATLTPIFPCSGFEEGMNTGSITIEARDPDTNELLDSITVDVMVTVTPSS